MAIPEGSGVREQRDLIGDVVAAAERLWRQDDVAATDASDLIRLRHACNLIELAFSRRADCFAESDAWEADGYVSPVAWMRHNCKMSAAAASSAITIGSDAAHLQASFAALQCGEIGMRHLSMLAGTLYNITRTHPAYPINEHSLLDRARTHSIAQFRHDCDHVRHAADARSFLDSHLEAVDARRLELTPTEAGCYVVRGFLDPEGGATVRTALNALARRTDAADDRNRDRRLADALIELSHHGLDAGAAAMQQTVRPHLQLTVSLETLAGLRGAAAELEHSTPIPGETARRLTCDATVRRVVVDAASAVLDVGRAQRIASPAQRTALAVRDKGCVWPGCDRPTSWTAAHHIEHWAQNGETELSNLALVCHRHHRMVHEGGWQIARAEDGQIVATRVPVVPLLAQLDSVRHAVRNRALRNPSASLLPAARGPDLVPA